ncbi:MAG: TIGR02646 family protein [Nitrosomonas sp.]|nr:TIGR02646 family protein [Nitrosomonas sp.]MCW5608746.1 TIGR02646 family protein [Nitrosomonas sp.]
MHKLNRACTAPPACLSAYDYQIQNWDDLDAECKHLLRAALVQMQGIPGVTTPESNEYGLRCAYCEGGIYHEGHIEHFRRKNPAHHPELTFAWPNLFLACDANTHCGHYKDRNGAQPYNPDHLIKPDEHDPTHYLYFHSSGEVRVRSGLNADDAHRAAETIRVFGLNDRALTGARARALAVYRERIVADLDDLATWQPADRQTYLAGEINDTRYEPYATCIKHFLQK